MRVSDVGEFGLIKLLSRTLGQSGTRAELLVGIGDDAAAWTTPESVTLATTDSLVEGIHFPPQTPWKELGWKALAINLSDIAAMGGLPKYALVALLIPADRQIADMVQLYEGIAEAAEEFNVTVAGGNVSRAPTLSVTIAVIGEGHRSGVLTRSAARPGDMIAVTGHLGASAAGQRMLAEKLQFDAETAQFLRKAHLHPQPRVTEGQLLATVGVRAAIDISDGLVSDMTHICEASHVGAHLNAPKLPIHPLTKAAFKDKALHLALSGGEDYELLFTADTETMKVLQQRTDCPITVIGEVVANESKGITIVDEKGDVLCWDQKGWDHFAVP